MGFSCEGEARTGHEMRLRVEQCGPLGAPLSGLVTWVQWCRWYAGEVRVRMRRRIVLSPAALLIRQLPGAMSLVRLYPGGVRRMFIA